MKIVRRAVPWLLVVLATACASWRWNGYAPAGSPPLNARNAERSRTAPVLENRAEDSGTVSLSTSPRADTIRVVVPPTPRGRFRTALFFSDMGPDTVDVSGYSAQQRYNYEIYARVCSRCHTLARSINMPVVGRGWWDFYLLGMRVRSHRLGRPLSKSQTKAVLDFLEYDSNMRKVQHAREFDRLTEVLKARFDASVAERVRAMHKANSRPLAPPPP